MARARRTLSAPKRPNPAGELTKIIPMNSSLLSVLSPLDGTVASLDSVPDPVFATGTVGAGIAVVPDPGVEVVEIVAPADGILTRVLPHLFVLDANGQRILVHLGVDTARLNGQGFDMHWPEGSEVTKGMTVCTYTPRELGRMGFDPIVVVVTMRAAADALHAAALPGEPISRGQVLYSC